jgi:hypothetical protein
MRDHVASSAAAASALASVGFPRLQAQLHRTVDVPELSNQTKLSSALVPGVGPLPAQGGMAKGDVPIVQHVMSSLAGAGVSAAATAATTSTCVGTATTAGGASNACSNKHQRYRQNKRQALGNAAYKAEETRKRKDRKR